MLKEFKEGMLTLTYQMQNINKEMEIIKRTKLKKTTTKIKICDLSC